MSPQPEFSDLTVGEFAESCQNLLVPVGPSYSYFSVGSLGEREADRLVFHPIDALPPAVAKHLPNLGLVLVPHLARPEGGAERPQDLRVSFQAPVESARQSAVTVEAGPRSLLFLPVGGDDTYDAHLDLYGELARQLQERMGAELSEPFNGLLERELAKNVKGEVDRDAWAAKQAALGSGKRRSGSARRADYFSIALRRTLSLYLHGLCCDITVEDGPRQLPTPYMRRRLLQLCDRLPPPDGVPLFPGDRPAAAGL